MARSWLSYQRILKLSEELLAEIQAFAKKQQQHKIRTPSDADTNRDAVKTLLLKYFDQLHGFSHYHGQPSASDKMILATWRGFLGPAQAFSELTPHGDFLSARMLLYLASAFRRNPKVSHKFPAEESSAKHIAEICDFLLALDDALLLRLTRIWEQSHQSEEFTWAFAEYSLWRGCGHALHMHQDTGTDEADNIKRIAGLTRPSEMKPENGIVGRTYWVRPDGDTTPHKRNPKAQCTSFGTPDENGDEFILMEEFGSDGPIRESYSYTLVDEDTQRTTWRERDLLRRSRQFILDAQKVVLLNTVHRALIKGRLPAELHQMITEYLAAGDDPVIHPYVTRIDLSAAYKPFPVLPMKPCKDCSPKRKRQLSSASSNSCPATKTAVAWNMPLRVFHTWHEIAPENWRLCKEVDCAGHHADDSWAITSDKELLEHLEGLVQSRCGPDATLKSIGLGELDNVVAKTAEESDLRTKLLFCRRVHGKPHNKDAETESCWTGIGGLVHAMMQEQTLLGKWQGPYVGGSGSLRMEANWLLGKSRAEQRKMIRSLTELHDPRGCNICR